MFRRTLLVCLSVFKSCHIFHWCSGDSSMALWSIDLQTWTYDETPFEKISIKSGETRKILFFWSDEWTQLGNHRERVRSEINFGSTNAGKNSRTYQRKPADTLISEGSILGHCGGGFEFIFFSDLLLWREHTVRQEYSFEQRIFSSCVSSFLDPLNHVKTGHKVQCNKSISFSMSFSCSTFSSE